jgi:ATP-dependent 26S proteasome regulatory subunit
LQCLPFFLPSAPRFTFGDGITDQCHSGLSAIKDYRDSISQDDFNAAVRKVAEAKKLEGKLEYQKL